MSAVEAMMQNAKDAKKRELEVIGTEYKGVCPFCKGPTKILTLAQMETEAMALAACRECDKIIAIGYVGGVVMNVLQSIKPDENPK